MLNNFLIWMGLKEKINMLQTKPPYFKEGEKWWIHFGENVGIEINGKGSMFARPGIIFKKLNNQTLLVVPLTTKAKQGTWFVPLEFKGIKESAVLSQIRIISFKRLDKKIGEINKADMNSIQRGLKELYFSDP